MEIIEKQVEEYIKSRFPRATEWEKKKITEDWSNKELAAKGIIKDFKKRAGDPSGKKILEIGFGNGIILAMFAQAGAESYGLEIDDILSDIAKKNREIYGVDMDLQTYDGVNFPFENNFFDYIYAVSVLEHVDDLVRVIEETGRVLKPGGKFYVSFPNRLWPVDTHTGVWFLNYAPSFMVPGMLKLFGGSTKEDWGLQFRTFWSFRRALKKSGVQLKIIEETQGKTPFRSFIKKGFSKMGIHFSAVLQTVMIVLEKKD